MDLLRAFLRRLLIGLAGVILLIEEVVWEALEPAVAWLHGLRLLQRLDAVLRQVSPWTAVVIFLVPEAVIVPTKFLALWLMAGGHAGLGMALFVAIKVLGTAVTVYLFTALKPKLMEITAFRACYEAVMRFKATVHAYLLAQPWYVAARDAALAAVRDLRARARAAVARVREELRAWAR
ncbi:MAG: hypothetical protein JNK11_16055 [Alphaproteobacteria bacterium]|nr:hypothetical protein [Alphaproteobacteria bacterium]